LDYNHYNTTEHLTGTMFEFGRYTLSYDPPEGAVEADVTMSISSEADLSQMLRFFESFLQAAGYVLGDKELTLERSAPDFDTPDFPHGLGEYTLASSAGTDFISLGDQEPASFTFAKHYGVTKF
jgi:hypothetical protein